MSHAAEKRGFRPHPRPACATLAQDDSCNTETLSRNNNAKFIQLSDTTVFPIRKRLPEMPGIPCFRHRLCLPQGETGQRRAGGVCPNRHARQAVRRLLPLLPFPSRAAGKHACRSTGSCAVPRPASLTNGDGLPEDARSHWPMPLKPMKASDISPAIISATGVPVMTLGRRQVSRRSRMPAISSRAKVKPTL